jgi:hypothetical protein
MVSGFEYNGELLQFTYPVLAVELGNELYSSKK